MEPKIRYDKYREFSTAVNSLSLADFIEVDQLLKELTNGERYFSGVQFSQKAFSIILCKDEWMKEIAFEPEISKHLLDGISPCIEKDEIVGRIRGKYFSVNPELDNASLFEASYVLLEEFVMGSDRTKQPIKWIITAPIYR